MPYGRSRLTASSQMGDPFLGGLIKGIGKVAGKVLGTTPLGAAAGTVAGAIFGRKTSKAAGVAVVPGAGRVQQIPVVNVPGLKGAAQRAIPGGATGLMVGGEPRKRRRRMNPTNIKALRRAVRREEAFIRAAKKTGLVTVPKAKRVRRAASPRRRS